MPSHDFEIEGYDVDMYFLDEGPKRSLRLVGSDDSGEESVAYLHFFRNERYADRKQLTRSPDVTALIVDLPLTEYDELYHVLQTEKPVYLYAEYEASDDPVRDVESVGITTELEMVGEGFEDLTP
jgi:hypothetical protein